MKNLKPSTPQPPKRVQLGKKYRRPQTALIEIKRGEEDYTNFLNEFFRKENYINIRKRSIKRGNLEELESLLLIADRTDFSRNFEELALECLKLDFISLLKEADRKLSNSSFNKCEILLKESIKYCINLFRPNHYITGLSFYIVRSITPNINNFFPLLNEIYELMLEPIYNNTNLIQKYRNNPYKYFIGQPYYCLCRQLNENLMKMRTKL